MLLLMDPFLITHADVLWRHFILTKAMQGVRADPERRSESTEIAKLECQKPRMPDEYGDNITAISFRRCRLGART